MDVSNPMSAVVPSAHGPVLAVLAGTATPLTGRKIAELTRPRVSQARTAVILRELVATGLVARLPAGSASLFALNREHLAAGPVLALATMRSRLWQRIAEQVCSWEQPPAAVLVYGSAARGDGGTESDIDLLVVRSDDEPDDRWDEQVTGLAAQVHRWTGNPCEVLDRSVGELGVMAAAGERLLAEIRRDGRAVVGSVSVVPTPRAA